jgi:hypothetical protein
MLALVSEIHSANSTSCVVRSHSVKLYNKSPIRDHFPCFGPYPASPAMGLPRTAAFNACAPKNDVAE